MSGSTDAFSVTVDGRTISGVVPKRARPETVVELMKVCIAILLAPRSAS